MIIINPDEIALFRMISMKSALELEILGMHHSSRISVYSRIKKEFNLTGNKKTVLEKFKKIIEEKKI